MVQSTNVDRPNTGIPGVKTPTMSSPEKVTLPTVSGEPYAGELSERGLAPEAAAAAKTSKHTVSAQH